MSWIPHPHPCRTYIIAPWHTVRTGGRAYSNVITKISGIDKFLISSYLWDSAGAEGSLKINLNVIEPNAPPVNVKGHNTSSTSIWVHWDTVPVADQNGIILSYTVTYAALPGGIPRTAVVSAPITHVTLRGLEEYTNYSILVFASTVKGDGNASDSIIVTTDEDSKLPKALR